MLMLMLSAMHASKILHHARELKLLAEDPVPNS